MRKLGVLIGVLAALVAGPAGAQGAAPTEGKPAVAGAAVPGTGATAPTARVPLDAKEVEAWLDGFMPYALQRGHVPGAVVVVVRGDGPVLAKGYGFADLAARKPVDPDATMFRPGSVSKLLTWTAVMQQVEAGKLDLDKDINAYLDFKVPPYAGKSVTLRHVLTHTAGFEESIRYLITSNPKALMPLDVLMKKALPAQVAAPGSTPAYSNYATALAGYVVQRVSGIPLETYFEKHIFAPIGMTRSTFRQPLPAALKPLMSNGYEFGSDAPKPFEMVLPWPAGSLSSTGADMGRFMIAHLNDGAGLLKPETARLMHDFRAPGVRPLNSMALGFYEQWVNGHRAIGHGGDTTQFHSYLWLFPDADIGLYVSMNSGGKEGASGAIRSALFHGFADQFLPGALPETRVPEAEARAHAQLVAGNYVSSRGAFTNFMSLTGLLGQGKIAVDDKGRIAFPALDGLSAGPRDWVEIEPFVWLDRNTGERLAVEVKDGRAVRMSVDAASPFMVFTPAPAATNAAWLLPAAGVALALALLAAIGWPVRALVRRSFGATFPLTGRSLTAWRLSRIFAWAAVIAAGGWMLLIALFSKDIGAIGGPLDWLIHLLRVLTPIASVGLVLTAGWHLWLCLRDRRRWTMILGALLLLLAGLVLLWITLVSHLYGFGMVY
jgi:CubicO group peptidase (beta-lactamase class C family)